jgi:hypothetical protein
MRVKKFRCIFGSVVDRDNIEFVWVEFEPAGPTWSEDCIGMFRWGAVGIGFGEIGVYRSDTDERGIVEFDTEEMSGDFLQQMIKFWISRCSIR